MKHLLANTVRRWISILAAIVLFSSIAVPAYSQNNSITLIPGSGGDSTILAFHYPNTVAKDLYYGWMFLYDTVVVNDSALAPTKPGLATKWKISNGGKTVTFTLRRNVKFHDGHTFDANDVKFTIESQNHPDSVGHEKIYTETPFGTLKGYKAFREGRAKGIAGIRVINKNTIRFEMDEANGIFMLGMAISPILPEHKLRNVAPGDFVGNDYFKNPIGTGPYQLTEIRPSEFYRFEAFNDYWDGAPKIETVFMRNIPADTAMRSGQADLLYTRDLEAVRVAEAQNYDLEEVAAVRTQVFRMNLNKKPFTDEKFRLALLHALDREAFLKNFFDDRGELTHGYMGPGFWHNDNLNPRTYDPDLARKLLRESSYNGETIELTYYYGDPITADLIAAIKQYWAQIGINAETRYVEGPVAGQIINDRSFNIMYAARAYADPGWLATYTSDSKNNYTGWGSKEFDSLVEKAAKETDISKRQRLYYQAQKLMFDAVVDHPLFAPSIINVSSKRLNVTSDPVPGLWYPVGLDVHKWTLR